MKPNNWVSSSQATELLSKQLVTWPLAEKNYKALEAVQVKSFDMGGFSIRAQFNPARIVSTGAKVDARSLKERKCFLCPENLPVEQERLPFGFRHLVLCNPYPIFPQHFTIPTRKHTPQLILPQWNDFLELTRRLAPFTVFYNGPRSGASAPDHAHFQAVTRGIMPLDEEVTQFIRQSYASVYDNRIYPLTGNLRPGLVIQAATEEAATRLFKKIYAALPILPGEPEPMMNIFGSSPMPSHRMERDTHEMGGMGLIRLKMGLKNALKYLLMPMKNPSGMPRAQAMPNPMNTRRVESHA